jgi:phosphate transport system substrate-binding protein
VYIRVLGPPPTSGTRDAFAELALEGGCKQFPLIRALRDADKSAYKARCHALREDGAWVEAGENDNLIVQKLLKDKQALGVFGYGFLKANSAGLQASAVDGYDATFKNITSGEYPLSRSLYFYVKKAHMASLPGIEVYMRQFISHRAMGEKGYLLDRGLIPLSSDELKHMQTRIAKGTTLLP